jgi:hypothetical protein
MISWAKWIVYVLVQSLIELIDYSYQQGASYFLEACLKNLMLGLKQFWDG